MPDMYYDRIREAGDIKRLPSGQVRCGTSHTSYVYATSESLRDPAVTVFVEYHDNKATDLYAMCKRHTGTVRAGITKGSWSFRSAEEVGTDVEGMAVSPAALLASLTAQRQIDAREAAAVREARILRDKREGWDKFRDNYNATEELRNPPERVESRLDDYGRAFVRVGAQQLTPKQARNLAARLLVLASEAEVETSVQVMP